MLLWYPISIELPQIFDVIGFSSDFQRRRDESGHHVVDGSAARQDAAVMDLIPDSISGLDPSDPDSRSQNFREGSVWNDSSAVVVMIGPIVVSQKSFRRRIGFVVEHVVYVVAKYELEKKCNFWCSPNCEELIIIYFIFLICLAESEKVKIFF